MRRLISVVVPAYNEEDNVQPFYTALKGVTDSLSEFDWEFLIVDDGSTDRMVERFQAIAAQDPRLRILQLSRNFGSYAALRAGFDHARGDAVVTISADLQDSPELFRAFVARWKEGYHTVWGVREQRDDPMGKKILASLFYQVIRRMALAGLPVGGMDCGLFDRKVVNAFREIPDRNNITFMTIYWMGFRQAQVPYHRRERKFGRSKWPFRKRLKAALDVITSLSTLPIRFISYTGMFISFLSFLAALVVLFNKLVLGLGEWGWPSLMVVTLFLGGIQLTMLGVVGEYLWRIGAQVRGQPWYIVMDKIGFPENEQRRPEA